MLVYFPRIGGIITAGEPPGGIVAVMVGYSCAKQIHKVNLMSKYLLEIKRWKSIIPDWLHMVLQS
jgi:hypothetical protein